MEILSNATFSGNITTNGDLNLTSGNIKLGGFSTWTCGFKSFSNSTFTFPDIGCGSAAILTTKHVPNKLNCFGNLGIFNLASPLVPEGCHDFALYYANSSEEDFLSRLFYSHFSGNPSPHYHPKPIIIQVSKSNYNDGFQDGKLIEFPIIEQYIKVRDGCATKADLVLSRISSDQLICGTFIASVLIGSTEFTQNNRWGLLG